MKKFLLRSFFSAVVFFGTGVLIFWVAKAWDGIVASPGDKLTATKWNESLVHNYASKITTADFSTTSTSFVSDPASNFNLTVKNNDLVLVIMDGKISPSPNTAAVYIKLNLSGPGTFLSSPTNQLYAQGLAWSPFSLTSLIKATGDGSLTLGYQGQCNTSSTCTYRGIEIKAVVIGKYQ